MLAIGLMSGTSLDGVDGALIETDGVRCEQFFAHTFIPYSPEFKAAFKPHLGRVPDLCGETDSVIPAGPRIQSDKSKNRHCEEGSSPTWQSRKINFKTGSPRSLVRELAMTTKENLYSSKEEYPNTLPALIHHLTHIHAQVVENLLKEANLTPGQIDVIGFHGQTVYHQPPQEGQNGQTFQVGDGQLLADLTGIPVVCQFRQNDMAHGGQGAPLVPVFHQALVADLPKPVAILNIGGVANVTYVGEGPHLLNNRLGEGSHPLNNRLGNNQDDLLGFDTGPGNGLIDDWMRLHNGQDYDADGAVASQGKSSEEVLQIWMTHPYFQKPIPKSLDRDQFRSWCFDNALFQSLCFEDQIASLSTLTALTIAKSREHMSTSPLAWYVAGGGARNPFIIKCLEKYLAPAEVKLAESIGFNGDMLEAQAFAYLAVRSLKGLPLTYPTTTGVDTPRSGGVLVRPRQQKVI